jgi:hypothetical protein
MVVVWFQYVQKLQFQPKDVFSPMNLPKLPLPLSLSSFFDNDNSGDCPDGESQVPSFLKSNTTESSRKHRKDQTFRHEKPTCFECKFLFFFTFVSSSLFNFLTRFGCIFSSTEFFAISAKHSF